MQNRELQVIATYTHNVEVSACFAPLEASTFKARGLVATPPRRSPKNQSPRPVFNMENAVK